MTPETHGEAMLQPSLSAGSKLDLAWRQKVGPLTWRLAVVEDIPSLNELWGAMDKKLGKQDRPDLFAMPVVLTLVAENENGVVVQGIYGEAVIDFTGIGTDRRAMASIGELFPALHEHFFERTIRVIRVLVPKRLAAGMKAMLPGMVELSIKFASFAYTIRL